MPGSQTDEVQFTHAQRRQMKQLVDCIDQIALADCEFLSTHNRQYRVRAASAAEIKQVELAAGMTLFVPPGRKLFAIVKRVAVEACTCLRIYAEIDEDARTESYSEAVCRSLFEAIATPEMLQAEADWVEARS